jgi:hypothetical protein
MKEAVDQFVKCTGNWRTLDSKEDLFTALEPLRELLLQEVDTEFFDSIKLRWVEGALDDYCDGMVYMCQWYTLLTRMGIDVVGACAAVCENNSLKYTTSLDLATRWLEEHKKSSLTLGIPRDLHICITEVDNETYYCLKDGAGKVRKFIGFPRVDLSKFIPQEFGGTLGLED